MIDTYFMDYERKYHNMKKALKRFIDAKSDFYSLSGVKYDDMPKAHGKSLGFDDLMVNIEELCNKYLDSKHEYLLEKDKCQMVINKLENPVYKVIIEYAYIDFENDKKLAASLKEFHNLDYSYSHLRKLKSQAIKEFEKVIQK